MRPNLLLCRKLLHENAPCAQHFANNGLIGILAGTLVTQNDSDAHELRIAEQHRFEILLPNGSDLGVNDRCYPKRSNVRTGAFPPTSSSAVTSAALPGLKNSTQPPKPMRKLNLKPCMRISGSRRAQQAATPSPRLISAQV